jgi:hypothetical protein
MLTLRLRRCEIDVLADELHHRRAAITEAAAAADAVNTRHETAARDPEVEERHDELLLVSRLLGELRTPAPEGHAREIVGPTWLLAPVIRGAAGEAVARLAAAVDEFREDRGTPTPDQLRAAVDTASAWTATLIGLDHAENHAVT